MTVIKCDRCGKDMLDKVDSFELNIMENKYNTIRIPDRYDLCKDCLDTLMVWLHPDRESQT